jgi:hypothetical protein
MTFRGNRLINFPTFKINRKLILAKNTRHQTIETAEIEMIFPRIAVKPYKTTAK